MGVIEFVRTVASVFENQEGVSPQTNYRNHQEWCSIVALTVMAVVRKKYGVSLKAQDLRSCTTLEDLYELVKQRL